jgi:hypothetical protein
MTYDAYLMAITQLSTRRKARVVVQGSVIFIETNPPRKKWHLSTKVFDGDGHLPKGIKECLSSSGILKWQAGGAYLHLDSNDNTVHLINEVDSSSKYIPFKHHIGDFVEIAKEWKEILDDFAQRDLLPIGF